MFAVSRRWLLLTVVMKVVVAIMFLVNVSASLGDVVVARQHYHQLANGHLSQAAAEKRWAPTEIRMNEFIHKIRSRFNSPSANGYVRRAAPNTTTGQSKGAAYKILKNNNRRAERPNRRTPAVKLYRLRTRWGRIPSAVNVGEK